MKLNWKKLALASVSALAALSTVAGTITQVKAQEGETLIVSAAGVYDYVSAHIAEFEEEYGVTVEVLDADMFEMLDGIALDGPAGTGADVYISPYDRIGSLGMTGQLAPVTLIDEAGYDETDIQQVSANGQIFGAPSVIETLVMFYNTELLDAAPTTFEELEAISQDEAYAFENEEGKNVGFLAKWTDFYFSYGLIAGYGGYVFGSEGTDFNDVGLNTPEAVAGIEYAVDWFQNTWPQGMQDVTASGDFMNQSFISGDTAAIISGPWDAAAFSEAGIPFGVAKIPTLPNGEEYTPFGGGKGWVISNYSEKQELAQQFIDWVSTEEQQNHLYNELNEIPANHAARDAAVAAGNELTTAVIEVYANSEPMPNIPQMAEVWVGAENLMFDAASGNKTAQESADAAVELITQTIEQKY